MVWEATSTAQCAVEVASQTIDVLSNGKTDISHNAYQREISVSSLHFFPRVTVIVAQGKLTAVPVILEMKWFTLITISCIYLEALAQNEGILYHLI